jgi:hypothetical protein
LAKKRINGKRKEVGGECAFAQELIEFGYDCGRGRQYYDANGNADVIGLSGIHIECKRAKKLNTYDTLNQAKRL